MISYGTGFIVLVWAEMRGPTSCDGKWLCRDHVSVYLTLKHSGKSSGVRCRACIMPVVSLAPPLIVLHLGASSIIVGSFIKVYVRPRSRDSAWELIYELPIVALYIMPA